MDLTQLHLILKARYKVITLIFLLIVISTTVITLYLPKTYESSTSLVLNYKGVDPVTGMVLPAQLMPGYMATQIDIINSQNVAVKVVKNLKLSENEVIQAQYSEATKGSDAKVDINIWLAKKISKGLDVKPSKKSSVIEIIFTGNDPNFSALIANAFATAYKETALELKVEPAKVAASFLDEQVAAQKSNLEKAQSKLSNYQQDHGLTNLNGNLDIENAKLNELSSQLVAVQSMLSESRSRQQSARSDMSPDIISNPLVQNLKLSVSAAETRLSELSERYGAAHPKYISAKAELSKQNSLLRRAINSTKGSVRENKNIYSQREKDLKAALAKQKQHVLKLNKSRDELSVLKTEVLNAQLALESASKRYTQTSQESVSNQSDISILTPATPPVRATGPNSTLHILLSIFLGGLLSAFIGLCMEVFDRRVRSEDDLVTVLDVPVFGIINNKAGTQNLSMSQNKKLTLKAG